MLTVKETGIWQGEWPGYIVRFETPEGQFLARTEYVGVRGTVKVVVTVKDGKVSAG